MSKLTVDRQLVILYDTYKRAIQLEEVLKANPYIASAADLVNVSIMKSNIEAVAGSTMYDHTMH